jgi:hypothetical protein
MRPFIVTVATLLANVVDASTLQPPVLPLIVRNPYLSTWLQNAREEPWSKWPMFWTGAEVCFPFLWSRHAASQVQEEVGYKPPSTERCAHAHRGNYFEPLKRSFERIFHARAFTLLFPTSSTIREAATAEVKSSALLTAIDTGWLQRSRITS